ncbi:MAG TPA: pyrroloquinoline quinone-dependent dehydrogenase [Chryseosolibacter sp.]|nr:pyrroloquinoline quinone-dependent dehydrogenase [Chryseosolibacter sp.]
MRRSHLHFALCSIIIFGCQPKMEHQTWSVYRADAASSAYSSLGQINKDNVNDLRVAWTYHTGDAEPGNRSTIQCNPVIVNGMMYVTSPKLKLIALDPATGEERWRFDPFQGKQAVGVNRGVSYWADGDDKRIFFTAGNVLYALNADNGTLVPDFGVDGKVDLRQGLGRDHERLSVEASSPGIIDEDLLIQGTALGEGYDAAPGVIRAYNARTGAIAWTFHTIPQPGEPGYETWPRDAYKEVGGVNSWAGMSLDQERGIVYIPTGSPAFDFYGGDRKGQNLYGNCLLALNAASGKLIWYYQLVHHDLWDYDLPAPPNLLTVKHDGKEIDAVAQVTKMGMVFVFDRETGRPLFPIEERPVAASTLLGEEVWTTQPFPVKPPPFSRHTFTKDDVTDISPESRAHVLEKIEGARYGSIYTPPDTRGVVQFPGTRGGAEWGGAAVDLPTGIMYVNANEIPLLISMRQIEVEGHEEFLASVGKRIYTMNACTSCHGTDREGTNVYPTLQKLEGRRSEKQVADVIRNGKGQMPPHPNLSDEDMDALLAFLFDRKDIKNPKVVNIKNPKEKKYRYAHSGWNVLTDHEGYPGVKPPWGTLNAIDLNKGEIVWRTPLGVYPELLEKGLPPTGTQNLGGPAVTAGGLVFIGATRDKKFRAFDKNTGEILWEHDLPGGGNATPSIYEVNGKQYVVIAAGGGGRVGSESSDAYVAFTLKP